MGKRRDWIACLDAALFLALGALIPLTTIALIILKLVLYVTRP